jgi:hypothetical protein
MKETVDDRPGPKRITRRRFLRDATLTAAGAVVAAMLPGCAPLPAVSTPSLEGSSSSSEDSAPSPTPAEPKPVPGEAPPPPKEAGPPPTEEARCKAGILNVYILTPRQFQFNQETFFQIASLYREQGGIFPSEAELWFHEEESGTLGCTNAEENFMEISFREIYESGVPEGYTVESLANGVLAGELCNLMVSESGYISGAEPPTRDNIMWVCESLGVMVEAICAGRSYGQYCQDTVEVFSYKGKPALHFDLITYEIFQGVLQEPLLTFD